MNSESVAGVDDHYAVRWAVLAAGGLALTLCVLLWESLFGGKVLTQADALYQFEPWSSIAPPGFLPSNELLLDQSTGFLPWLDFQAEQIGKGELPLWNPFNYCGEPLVGTYQSAVYWPLNWIYYAWPSWHAHAWIAFFRLWLAGFFTFLFLRRLGMRAGPACVGGLGYMLSGFMVAWLNHPHVSCALFLPALLWSVERALSRPCAREGALFGLLFGLQLLAGHIQTSLYLTIFTSAYALFHLVVLRKSWRHKMLITGWLCAGGLLGCGLAAPQVLPFVEYLGHSQASEVFERMETVSRQGVTPAAILMLDPHYYGAPHTHDYTGPRGDNLNYNELIGGYVGRILVLLALLQTLFAGWWKKARGPTFFFVTAVVLSGLIAFQVEPLYSFFSSIPRLRSTKLMRVLQFVAFGLAVLGAMGLDRIVRHWKHRWLVVLGVFLTIATEQIWFARGYNPQVDPGILVPRTEVTDFLRENQGLHRTLGVDNNILRPNANVFYRISMVSGYDSMEDRNLTNLALRMSQEPPRFPFLSQVSWFTRIEAFPLMSLFGIRYFLADDPLPEPLRKVIDAEVQVYENPNVMPRAFLARDVRVIENEEERLTYMAGTDFDPWVAVLGRPSVDANGYARVPANEPGRSVEITRYSPRQVDVRVTTRQRALMVLTDVWNPGWSAEIIACGADGAPSTEPSRVEIDRVDHAFRGVWVDPGEWQIRFRYDPMSTTIGLGLALFAILTLVLLASRRATARPQHPAPLLGRGGSNLAS